MRILLLSVLGFFGLLILGNWLALEVMAWLLGCDSGRAPAQQGAATDPRHRGETASPWGRTKNGHGVRFLFTIRKMPRHGTEKGAAPPGLPGLCHSPAKALSYPYHLGPLNSGSLPR